MEGYREWAEQTLDRIVKKLVVVAQRNQGKIPYTTNGEGRYDDKSDEAASFRIDDGINWWTNGFWGGILWTLYQETGEELYIQMARESMNKMEKGFQMFYGLHHDVGFMFQPTAVLDYRLTGSEGARRIALRAANFLAGRFNPAGRFIRAWNDIEEKDTRGWAIIDCLFNLSILYWASEETKDPRFCQVAVSHADTVMKNFVREDGSVCHIVEFDPHTGRRLCEHGGQGYSVGSAWTRGQGWALYGFVNSYAHTGKREYLDTAIRVAEYCMQCIPENGIVPVDFRQPTEPSWEDSCGACIIAGGLLQLSKHVEKGDKERYFTAAVRILRAIAEHRADWTSECDAIVQNCSGEYHSKHHHFTMVYADYFFLEALLELAGRGNDVW